MSGRTKLVLLIAILVLPGIGFVLLGDGFEASLADRVREYQGWPLACVVAASLASDLLLPIPSSVVLAFAGRELGVVWATVAGAVGLTVSCEIGYWAARLIGGRFVKTRTSDGDRSFLAEGVAKRAAWWLVLSRPLPILAEAATLIAGLSRLRHGLFLGTVAIANVWVAACFSALGVLGSEWHPTVLLTVSAVVPLAATWVVRWVSRRQRDES